MRTNPAQFKSASSHALFSRIQQGHYLKKIEEPTFSAWRNKRVRDQIENYILTQNFKTDSAIGRKFIDEIYRLIRSSGSEIEFYNELRKFFESKGLIKTIFSEERKNRLDSRCAQVITLLGDQKVSSLLDVGCGSGEIAFDLMKSLNLIHKNVTGLEVILKEEIKAPINIVRFDGFNFPTFEKPFDLITVFSVLHHSEDPIQLIKEIGKVLAKDGCLIIRDCDAYDDDSKLFNLIADYLWYRVYTPCKGVPVPGNYFSQADWAAFFEQEGFKVEKTIYPESGNPYNPFMMLLSQNAFHTG